MNTIHEVLEKYNVPMAGVGQHHHARPGWIQTDCPNCTPNSGKYRLGYNTNGHYWNCWACGPKQFTYCVADLIRKTVAETKEIIKGIKISKVEFVKTKASGALVMPRSSVKEASLAHRSYLHQRGFNRKTIEQLWHVSYIGLDFEGLNWRIVIPIRYNGVTVSWTTRSIKPDAVRRYWSAKPEKELMLHKDLLYGEEYCRTDSIVIHEGPLDVWTTGPGSVCTFGTNFSSAQIAKMAQYRKRYVCFDSTPEGQVSAKKLCSLLKGFEGQTFNVILEAKDAGEQAKRPREVENMRSRLLWPSEPVWLRRYREIKAA